MKTHATHLAPRRRHWRPRWMLAALGVVALIGAASCGTDDNGSADGASDAESPKVVLVTYDSFVMPEGAAEEFESRTGATIEVVATGDSGTMLTGALLTAGSPDGDVIFGIDDNSVGPALSEDLLDPVAPSTVELVPEQFRLGGAGAERLVAIDSGDVCMNVDEEWFASNGVVAPTTIEQLADPEYRDLLVVSSPVTSSPGLAFLIGSVDRFGEDGWIDYWAALEENGVRVRPSWDDAYNSDYTVSGGDRPIVLSYASSPPAEVIFSDGARSEPASSVMVDSCVAQREFAGVLRGTEQPELAAELLEFMLSPQWQQGLPLANFVIPVTDVELPDEFQRWAARPEQPMSLAPDVVDERRDEWIEAWREQME